MSAPPEFQLSSLAWTALGAGAVCAGLKAASWRNERATRFLVALPLLTVVLVFLVLTGPRSDDGCCLARAREELEICLVYSLTSIVFVLVWLACLDQAAARLEGVKLGACASGAFALLVWFACMSVLQLFVLS